MEAGLVIDASVAMSWCFLDESNAYSDIVLDALAEYEAYVPSIWPLEIGNVLLVAERRKRLSEADSTRFLALLKELPIHVEQEPPARMTTEILYLAREYNLSSYDASYLDLAMRKELPIATQDSALLIAARKVKVSVFSK